MKNVFLACLLFLCIPMLLNGQDSTKQDVSKKLSIKDTTNKNDSLTIPAKAFVKAIKNTDKQAIQVAKYGTKILVQVENLKELLGKDWKNEDTLILFINGQPMSDLIANTINLDDQCLSFYLNRKSVSLGKLKMNFSCISDTLPVSVSVGKIGGTAVETLVKSSDFYLSYVGKYFVHISLLSVLIFVACFYILMRKSNMLRGGTDGTPYSLAQTQLAFWTLIVSISYLYIYATTQNIPDIPEKVLWLLGISITTTGGAKIIDNNKVAGQFKYPASKGFWVDIFSDNFGINIHRFQMVLWTLIMGLLFVISVIQDQKMIEFSEQLLLLMGISSGAYLGLKIPENNKPALKENTANPTAASPAAVSPTPANPTPDNTLPPQ
jgi:hypothetical protein